MKIPAFLAGAVLAASAAYTAGPVAPAAPSTALPAVRIPSFAAALNEQETISSPDGWEELDASEAWRSLATATSTNRQARRWIYARSRLAAGQPQEALGALDVMLADDPDLRLVGSFRLARGAALSLLKRHREALDSLMHEELGDNPEAAAWRTTVLAELGNYAEALEQHRLAGPALAARGSTSRLPFTLAAARAAVASDQPRRAISLLKGVARSEASANLIRGKALHALGEPQRGRLRLAQAMLSGTAAEQMDARISELAAAHAREERFSEAMQESLSEIALTWRGDDIERRALRLIYAVNPDNDARALAAGATLLRYFDLGLEMAPLASSVQQRLSHMVEPAETADLEDVAGLLWEYRDLLPAGPEGDRSVQRLAQRLKSESLYARAAELLNYQLLRRADGIAKGPLSAEVASLYILAREPEKAMLALSQTSKIQYPEDMHWDRKRMEAIALHQLTRTSEALAVLQDIPASEPLRAELLWKSRDWSAFEQVNGNMLPSRPQLDAVSQTIVLRQAIALAMLQQTKELASLQQRFGSAFAKTPVGAVFDMLTARPQKLTPGELSRAMTALPSLSPAGADARLIDAS